MIPGLSAIEFRNALLRSCWQRLPLFHLLLVDRESGLLVIRQGNGVVESASVQPESSRAVVPGFVDSPPEEVFAEALADELGHQSKLHQLDLALDPPVQFGETGRDALDMQDVNLVSGVVDDAGLRGRREAVARSAAGERTFADRSLSRPSQRGLIDRNRAV